MSATKRLLEDMPPKPKIRQAGPASHQDRRSTTWIWECACGRNSRLTGSIFLVALDAANQHSRTHTADRIAHVLEQDSLRARDVEDDARQRGRTHLAALWAGISVGKHASADLIREHLVGRTA